MEYAYTTDNFTQMDGKAGMSDINANWRTSIPFSKRLTLQPMLYGRCLFGANIPVIYGNTIGGEWFGHYIEQQMPFAGTGNLEYTDLHFIALQLQAQQRIATNNFILLRLAAAQHADEFKDILQQQTMLGAQLAYYYNTLFGPLGATLGYSNKSKQLNFYINLGFEF
jgi:NTE family protein